MFIIYDLFFIIGFLFYFPVLLAKGKVNRYFLNRLGFFLKRQNKKTIWLHAVSVGEVNCLKELIIKLKNEFADFSLVVSTVTTTGNKIANSLKCVDYVFYLPFDLSFVIARFIKFINPKLVIIVETEFWPNFIDQLYRKKIPTLIVNGRISDRSYKKYIFFKFIFKNILSKIQLFCMQTQSDAKRLVSLGVDPSKIKITGNMKFDMQQEIFCNKRNLGNDEILLVCGSTHEGEEYSILSCFKDLVKEFPNLRLLIAPRHVERNNVLKKIISQEFCFKIKEVRHIDDIYGEGVFLVNAMGILGAIYSIADIVFVGGSLVKKGGQNILEPAFFAKAIILGEYYFNFRDIVELFKVKDALIVAKNKNEICAAVRRLIINKDERVKLGLKAKELLNSNQGATLANLKLIKELIKA